MSNQNLWLADKSRVSIPMMTGSMNGRRSAIASAEPEDAHITGMTRSLDRRLLALNLKPVASVMHESIAQGRLTAPPPEVVKSR